MSTHTDKYRKRAAVEVRFSPGPCFRFDVIASELCIGIIVLALVLFPEYAAAGENAPRLRPASTRLSAPPRDAQTQYATRIDTDIASHHRAYFGPERASSDARQIADWIVDSADNAGLPFVIVDKIDARIFVFDPGGRIQGAAPALLGAARGDDTVPGIGERELSDMPPETRTTPAGRFVAALGMDARGEDVVWVDYEAAVSLHRVITFNPQERRLERLATPTPLDNRISYGCINVPKRFYEKVVSPAFTGTAGIVYVLPETRPARELFGAYDVDERLRQNTAGETAVTKSVSSAR
jgi:hypothetical protein